MSPENFGKLDASAQTAYVTSRTILWQLRTELAAAFTQMKNGGDEAKLERHPAAFGVSVAGPLSITFVRLDIICWSGIYM
jgi:hypothetical protein